MIPDYSDAPSLASLFLPDRTKILPLSSAEFTASNELCSKLKMWFGLWGLYYDTQCTRMFMLLFLSILEFCIFEFMCEMCFETTVFIVFSFTMKSSGNEELLHGIITKVD